MVSHKVPATLMTPYSYPMGHHSHSFVSKNSRKRFKKHVLDNAYSITSYSIHKYVLWSNEWCSIILWYHTRCLLHSWPDIVTHCHSLSFVSINGQKWLKMCFVDANHHNPIFYTQICSMGQWVVFNHPKVSPKLSTTIVTLYIYPTGNHSQIRGYGGVHLQIHVFQLFSTIFAYKWVAMVAYGATVWGHECSKHLRWYHRITVHHSLAHRPYLWEE
jgi:hypothetical protein